MGVACLLQRQHPSRHHSSIIAGKLFRLYTLFVPNPNMYLSQLLQEPLLVVSHHMPLL